MEPTKESENGMTDQEAAIYDRQIRLWGVEAQRRMRESTVLFIGFRALGAEICKNLVLAGISVAIMDSDLVTEKDVVAHLFLEASDIGRPRATVALERIRELNPLVAVNMLDKKVNDLNTEDLQPYSIVCVADSIPISDQININNMCRKNSIGYFGTATFGFSSYLLVDLGDVHKYVKKVKSGKRNADGEDEMIQKSYEVNFCSLERIFSIPVSDLQVKIRRGKEKFQFSTTFFVALMVLNRLDTDGKFLSSTEEDITAKIKEVLNGNEALLPESEIDRVVDILKAANVRCELSPICAVMGGIVGQEITKAVSGIDEPVNNVFLFNGLSGVGIVRKIGKQ